MARFDLSVNPFSLSSDELASACQSLAEDAHPIDPTLKAEAKLLLSSWQEALQMHGHHFDDQAHKESLLAALRKRTIEIAVKARQQA
jgi:hypothetical protein